MPLESHQLIDRELSWLEFNRRVLAEGMDPDNLLLERLKFIGIVSSNFDEFFMVRIPSLKQTPELLRQAYERSYEIMRAQNEYFENTLMPGLDAAGMVRIFPPLLNEMQREHLKSLFLSDFYPLLTPLAIRNEAPFPPLNSLGIHLAFTLTKPETKDEKFFTVIEIPRQFPRFIPLASPDRFLFILMEDLIYLFSDHLYPSFQVEEWGVFRLTRASELTFDEEKDEDFAKIVTEALRERREGEIVRLEASLPPNLLSQLKDRLGLKSDNLLAPVSWIDLKSISQLAFQGGFREHKNPPITPYLPALFENQDPIWKALRESDILVHHPYDSFETFDQFLNAAADDPDVLMIKQTLYRAAYPSAVISALERAAENGKQVTVLVELKARFDEEKNIHWADRLRRIGATVLYGIAGFKVHSKACLVVRREPDGIHRYLHLGTGNYNERTAQVYSDFGYFTADEKLTSDAVSFFNVITGFSTPSTFSKLEMAPYGLKRYLLRLILREAMHSRKEEPGLIMAKMNSLVDPDIIEALYRASKAGVKIKLNVRGICCLRPGVKDLSENIEVCSIVDMFLEHARVFYFRNGGNEEIYLSSADWMPRNLERRVELMFPVEPKRIKKELIETLKLYFKDNVKSWRLFENGEYQRMSPQQGEKKFRVQEYLLRKSEEKNALAKQAAPMELKPQKPKS